MSQDPPDPSHAHPVARRQARQETPPNRGRRCSRAFAFISAPLPGGRAFPFDVIVSPIPHPSYGNPPTRSGEDSPFWGHFSWSLRTDQSEANAVNARQAGLL